jgi:hypothetical protein
VARNLRFALPPIRGAGAQLALAFVIVSVVAVLSPKWLATWFVLSPEYFLHRFALFQPLSYAFIGDSPTAVIFGAIILWSIGAALEADWGRRRLLMFAIGAPAAAGLLVIAMSFFLPAMEGRGWVGGTALTSAVWVGYGLRVGRHQTNFWGLPVTGNVLALIGVGFVFLDAAYKRDWIGAFPAVLAMAFAFAYVQWGFPANLFERLGSWRLKRQLSRRSSQLKVVSGGDRNMPTDSDKYLH